MSPDEIVSIMQENKIKKLCRIIGAPLSQSWQGFGQPQFVFGYKDVACALLSGKLSAVSTANGNQVEISVSIIKGQKHEARSAAAQKAARTRANQPPSSNACRVLRRMGPDWYAPDSYAEKDDLMALVRKGMAMWGEFKTPSGTIRRYLRTGRGAEYLNAHG